MYPILFKIGPITLFTYGFMIAVAFVIAIIFVFREAHREGINTEKFADLGFFIIISGIIGSRILYILINWPEYLKHPLSIFKVWEGGLVFYGGILGAMITSVFLLKRYKLPFWEMMDIFAPAVVLAQAIGRIGCFMAGCCYGISTNIPWAVKFNNYNTLAPRNIFIHPTQLYHSFANIIIFLILIYILRKRRHFKGQIFSLYICLYSVGRLLVEFFRGDSWKYFFGFMNLTQGISIIIFLCGLYIYFWRKTTLHAKRSKQSI